MENLEIQINLKFLATMAHLPLEGECWYKNVVVRNVPWRKHLTNKDCEYHFNGMHVSSLKPKWNDLLHLIHQNITCEGWYSVNVSHQYLNGFGRPKS